MSSKPERPDVQTRHVLMVMVGFLVLMAAVAFGFTLIFQNRIGMRFVPQHAFPAPSVIADEREVRIADEARQRKILAGGNGRMPIDEAMQAIAARGSAAFDPVP